MTEFLVVLVVILVAGATLYSFLEGILLFFELRNGPKEIKHHSGTEALVGQRCQVTESGGGTSLRVLLNGENWQASLSKSVSGVPAVGSLLRVVGVSGLILHVEPLSESNSLDPPPLKATSERSR